MIVTTVNPDCTASYYSHDAGKYETRLTMRGRDLLWHRLDVSGENAVEQWIRLGTVNSIGMEELLASRTATEESPPHTHAATSWATDAVAVGTTTGWRIAADDTDEVVPMPGARPTVPLHLDSQDKASLRWMTKTATQAALREASSGAVVVLVTYGSTGRATAAWRGLVTTQQALTR